VRAGGDAFLLKNGPSRHLIDAISYVCDGGQYFSPQLRRDGLDRRLLEEPPRAPAPPMRESARVYGGNEDPREDRPETRETRPRRPARRASHESNRLRDRLREEPAGDNLEEHDY
jgi:hypothetical protein